jgi:hypothetical protein
MGLPVLSLLFLLCGTSALGQEVPPSTPKSLSEDAESRFALIQKMNAVDISGGHAWHIKLSQLAAESARSMEFRPFIVRGEAVEVKTQWGFSK